MPEKGVERKWGGGGGGVGERERREIVQTKKMIDILVSLSIYRVTATT